MRNHIRCCASDSGTSPALHRLQRQRGGGGTGTGIEVQHRGQCGRCRVLEECPHSTREPDKPDNRPVSCVAVSELPPSSKKLASALTRSTPNISAEDVGHRSLGVGSRRYVFGTRQGSEVRRG